MALQPYFRLSLFSRQSRDEQFPYVTVNTLNQVKTSIISRVKNLLDSKEIFSTSSSDEVEEVHKMNFSSFYLNKPKSNDKAPPSWFKKRTAYLIAFIDFFQCKNRKEKFTKPKLDASYLERAMERLVIYTEKECFGKAVKKLQAQDSDCFQDSVKLLAKTASSKQQKNVDRPCLSLLSAPLSTLRWPTAN